MSCPPWIWTDLNEQFPMVCLGCLENKYFPRDLIFHVGWIYTKPSGTSGVHVLQVVQKAVSNVCNCVVVHVYLCRSVEVHVYGT